MKILHLNSNYLYTELHEELINKLNRFEIENTIFMPTMKQTNIHNGSNNNLIVVDAFTRLDRYFFYKKQRKIYNTLKNEINEFDYDLVHAHTLFTDGNLALELYKEYNIKYVVTIRNTDINYFFKLRFLLRKRGIDILNNASAIFFLSDASRDLMIDKYVPEEYKNDIEKKVSVIPNGISDFWFNNVYKKKKNVNENYVNLLFVGRVNKNKNISATIDAIKHLLLENSNLEMTFTIIGKVENRSLLQKIKKKASKIEKLKLNTIPFAEKEDLLNVYRKSDIFIMPSIYESFGLVYAEAMSQGLPVIYTKNQGFDGHFGEGDVGYRVNPLSSTDIANKITMVIKNYNNISSNTIKKINKFDWENITQKYYDLYKTILNN